MVTSDVTLHVSETTGCGLAVHMATHVEGVDRSTAERLVAKARNICTYSDVFRQQPTGSNVHDLPDRVVGTVRCEADRGSAV